MSDCLTLIADRTDRLDRLLARMNPAVSRARFQRLIADGQVRINGERASQTGQKIRPGDAIIVTLPTPEPAKPRAEAMALDILYEDNHLIVVNKPAGLVVHPAAGHAGGTLVNALVAHCGQGLSGIGGVRRPGIVHRLDKDTSGLLVVAKTDPAHVGLAEQFAAHGRDGRLQRAYLAFVWGVPDRPSGTITTGIARSTTNRQKMTVSAKPHARKAVTRYTLREAFGSACSLVECQLETGRTHQIRVHMAHMGHPLLADSLYGSGFKSAARRLPEVARVMLNTLNRQALHAWLLAFEHPVTKQPMRFESTLPADLSQLHHELRVQSKAGSIA